MTPDFQKSLFKRVRSRFRRWNKRQCSGYVHGVADQDRDLPPSPDMIARCNYIPEDIYAVCYLYGYADALGPDAAEYPWCYGRSVIEHRWWINDSTSA